MRCSILPLESLGMPGMWAFAKIAGIFVHWIATRSSKALA